MGTKTPTYDVIVAAYNSGAYIGRAIQSVLDSTMPPRMIIVVDDASEDDTAEIASEYDRVKVIRNARNLERSRTRNTGIRVSDADFIQFLDADDLLAPEKVATQLEVMEQEPETDVTFGDVRLFRNGEWPGQWREYPPDMDVLEQLIRKNILALHSLLFRSSFFDRFGMFDESLPISEDRELYIRSLLNGARWRYTPGATVYYRQHDAGTIRSRGYESARYNAVPVRRHRKELAAFGEGRYRKVVAESIRTLARNANIAGRPLPEITEMIDEALELDPGVTMDQNRVYQTVENLLGPKVLERLLRPRFRI